MEAVIDTPDLVDHPDLPAPGFRFVVILVGPDVTMSQSDMLGFRTLDAALQCVSETGACYSAVMDKLQLSEVGLQRLAVVGAAGSNAMRRMDPDAT